MSWKLLENYRPVQNQNNQISSMSYPHIMYSWTGPDSTAGRVSAPGNGRSRVRSRAATYQSR